MPFYTCPACGRNTVASVSHYCLAGQVLPEAGRAAAPAGTDATAARRTLAHYARTNSAMDSDPVAGIVPPAYRLKWDHALSNFLSRASGDKNRELFLARGARIGRYTVADYAAMSEGARLALLNLMWNAQVIWVKGNKNATQMYDAPEGDPVHFTSSHRNAVPLAFRRFGIGFRSEKDGDIQRILREGFRPLFRNLAAAEARGFHVSGTVMDTLTRKEEIAFYIRNQDVVGNTGICISRNLLGATKFPEPMYEGDAYTFAVRPTNLGYDTEAWQAMQGDTAVWRPGEKAFAYVAVDDVVAYTKVHRLPGGTEANMWTFQFVEAKWKYLRPVSSDEAAYLDGELAAMRALGQHAVPKSDDFYRN